MFSFRVLLLIISLVPGPLFAGSQPSGSPQATNPSVCNSSPNIQLQILLDLAGFSPGEIDGNFGSNTRKAISAYQKSKGLKVTGAPDKNTLGALKEFQEDSFTLYTITTEDANGPFIDSIPEDAMEKAQLRALDYRSSLELLSEKFHTKPELLRDSNPKSQFESGEQICVPNVLTEPKKQVERKNLVIIVSEEKSDLVVQNSNEETLFYAPVTAGSEQDPLPQGTWKVTGVTENPTFYYNPDLFWDADPSHSKAVIRPGPNNPVGIIWIDISAEHYGLHGTPEPGKIGYAESYGCVRLTNWDVAKLAQFVTPGTRVIFNDAKKLAKH